MLYLLSGSFNGDAPIKELRPLFMGGASEREVIFPSLLEAFFL